MPIEADASFSSWFLTRAEIDSDAPDDVRLGDGIYATRCFEGAVEQRWRVALGSFLIDERAEGR